MSIKYKTHFADRFILGYVTPRHSPSLSNLCHHIPVGLSKQHIFMGCDVVVELLGSKFEERF